MPLPYPSLQQKVKQGITPSSVSYTRGEKQTDKNYFVSGFGDIGGLRPTGASRRTARSDGLNYHDDILCFQAYAT